MTGVESFLKRELNIRFIDARSLATEDKNNLNITGYPSAEQKELLKVEAMRESLAGLGFPEQEVATCTQHFKDNFGISRYVHVDYFITHYLTVEEANVDDIKQGILEAFSDQCNGR